MKKNRIVGLAVAAVVTAGCGMLASKDETAAIQALTVMKASFKESGQAKLDRLNQDETQRLCSVHATDKVLPKDVAAKIEKANLDTIKYPSDGKMMGDWKQGERIAQSGVGKQFTDGPDAAAGGNCYACHQLSKAEMSYGTIGPSLYNFGKVRGFTPEMQKYAYGKIYNSQAFSACSTMPRFGHQQILTEKQLKDLVALLMDPESPVNK
jgi:L-cysteine S-thiosulfotransferase